MNGERARSSDGDLVFNERLKLTRVHQGGELVAVAVLAPELGRHPRKNTVARTEEPGAFAFLERIAAKPGAVDAEVDEATWARLVDLGVLVPPGALVSPVRFRCPPLDPPRDLLPGYARARDPRVLSALCSPPFRAPPWGGVGVGSPEARAPGGATDRLRVSGSLRCASDPCALAGGPGPFATSSGWARVDHAGAAAPSLYSLDDDTRDLFDRLAPLGPPPDLAPEVLADLAVAGVLTDPADEARRASAWGQARGVAAADLARERWAVLSGLLHPFTLAALRRYFRELVRSGAVDFGDAQVPLRYFAHDDPIARMVHRHLAPLVSAVAGGPFKPSYVYFASYRPGATLAPHRDREQCQLSISLLLDYEPEPEGPSPWPLYLGEPGRATPIHLGLGDGLLYHGTELTHFRGALPEGHTSTSLFLHYVPLAFTGALT